MKETCGMCRKSTDLELLNLCEKCITYFCMPCDAIVALCGCRHCWAKDKVKPAPVEVPLKPLAVKWPVHLVRVGDYEDPIVDCDAWMDAEGRVYLDVNGGLVESHTMTGKVRRKTLLAWHV